MADKKFFLIYDKDGILIGKLSYSGVSADTQAHILKGLEINGSTVEEATQAAYDLRKVWKGME